MLLRIRFLPPGYANPGVVEVVLAQVGEARTVEVFWEKLSIIMKANTENFRLSEFLSDYNYVAVVHFAKMVELAGNVPHPRPTAVKPSFSKHPLHGSQNYS